MTDLELYYIYKTEKGLRERGLADKPEYVERLKYENEVIMRMGFPGYFLIVQDFIDWCRRNGIYVGPGRGSAAGSLACYCLGITNLDPIRWDLLFERFLNPDRVSMPDIDVDFEKRYRDRVIDYVIERFGPEYVAHIGTYNLMRAKAAIRSVTRTLGLPYEVGDKLSKLCLPPIAGKPQPLITSIQRVPELHSYMSNIGSSEEEVIKWALELEDSVASAGVHASGIVISNVPLTEVVPLFRGRSGEITTQWEMDTIEKAGLIKFDFLGLKALEIIHQCVDLVKEIQDIDIDIDNIHLDDEETFAGLRRGDNINVFQLEGSSGIRDLLVQIRPTEIEDLIAIVAIYRPGPLESDYKEVYLGVRAGIREPEYLVPELEPILKRTAGWLIYQEQIIEIAKQLCGYTGGEADELRKAVGKKIQDLMDKHEPKFKEGWVKNGLPIEAANHLWDDMVAFAKYGFNRSHAAAYAYITYQTAYLKTHFPLEFMCAVMQSEANDKDDIIKCLAECRKIGIKVLPPDINTSESSFSIGDGKTIRFGLGPVKYLGESPVELIIKERENGPFNGLIDFCNRVDLGVINRLKLESLIKAGAFDRFGRTRASLLQAVQDIWNYRDRRKSYESKLETYRKRVEAYEQRERDIEAGLLSATGKPLKSFKVPEKPEPPTVPQIPDIEELPLNEVQKQEHELLGFYVSSHPLDGIMTTHMGQILSTVDDAKNLPAKTRISIGAVITNTSEITTRRKKKMAFLSLEDLTGSIEAVCFPSTYEKYKALLDEDRPLKVYGTVEVTENDEDKISKIIVNQLQPLDVSKEIPSEKIDAVVSLTRARELLRILDRYSGTKHEVKITLEGHDGTKFTLSPQKIGDLKGAFMRELARISND